MRSVPTKKLLELRQKYSNGIAGIDQETSALTQRLEKLNKDRIATLGAVSAIDKLLEEPKPAEETK